MPHIQRIGVYGGAFDPPHAAHLAVARAAIDQLGLDELHVIPTGDAWHKSRALSPAADRLALCRLAFAGWPRVVVDARELHRLGPTYTIDTLTELRAQHPQAELFLVIGSDQAHAFSGWRRAHDIVSVATVTIAERADFEGANGLFDTKNALPGLDLQGARPVQRLQLLARPHSSTTIRARVAAGRGIARLVPAAVARYIADHHLYQSPSMSETAAKKDVQKLQRAIVDGLEDVKGQDIRVFNTEHLSPLFERVIVASGTSNRQTKALAASVRDKVRDAGFAKPRIEGEDNGEWIIVDCGAAVAHVMQPMIRQYYNLEEIWGEKPVRLRSAAPALPKATAKPAQDKPAASAKAGARKAAPAKASKAGDGKPAAARKSTARDAAGTGAPGRKAPARKPAGPASVAKKVLVVGKPVAKTAAKTAAKTSAAKAPAKTAAKAPAKAPPAKTAPARKAAPARKTPTRPAR